MNTTLKTILIAIATAVLGYFAGTNMTPSVDFHAVGTDFNLNLDSAGNACLSFHKTFDAPDVDAAIDSLLAGIGDGNSVRVKLSADADGNFVLDGSGCATVK